MTIQTIFASGKRAAAVSKYIGVGRVTTLLIYMVKLRPTVISISKYWLVNDIRYFGFLIISRYICNSVTTEKSPFSNYKIAVFLCQNIRPKQLFSTLTLDTGIFVLSYHYYTFDYLSTVNIN